MVFAFCLYVQLGIIEADMFKSSSTLISVLPDFFSEIHQGFLKWAKKVAKFFS